MLERSSNSRKMVNLDGSWNLELFRVWVTEDVINRITSIPPPHPDSDSDKVIWARSMSGVFSVRNTYWSLKEDFWNSQDEHRKINWKYPGPQRDSILTWSCLFGLISWRIWKNRNLFIFQRISWTTFEVVKVSSCWARQYESHLGDHNSNNQSSNSTNNLDDTWEYLSTGGVVARESGYAATGGVAHDHDGNWIVRFTRFLGVCSPFEAEVWGILNGILIVLNKGYRWIIIMTDNLPEFD
ncbi:uncharacterized protein LOC105797534 [Gossypium raimondii]|uniref:uncharacterized protein LOC105797534 n=1 Tax=Gossypium raimondii TaxID=29730 RepID=UPI00227B656F|nr:uncharacterized protein LOC105797534 [Gossypium raimondii]